MLAGYVGRFVEARVQVLGETEVTYLRSLGEEERTKILRLFFSYPIPCVMVTKGLDLPPGMETRGEAGRRRDPPLAAEDAGVLQAHHAVPRGGVRADHQPARVARRRVRRGTAVHGQERHRQVRVRARSRRARTSSGRGRPGDGVATRHRRADRPRPRALAPLHGNPRRRPDRHPEDLRHPRRAPAEAHRGDRRAREVGRARRRSTAPASTARPRRSSTWNCRRSRCR